MAETIVNDSAPVRPIVTDARRTVDRRRGTSDRRARARASMVTVRLSAALHDALIKRAAVQTEGNVSELLRRIAERDCNTKPIQTSVHP